MQKYISDSIRVLKSHSILIFSVSLALLFVGIILKMIINITPMELPGQPLIFTEHKVTFSEGHEIKVMNIKLKKIIDLGIKTYSWGYFFLTNSSNIAWIGLNSLYIYDPLTKVISEKELPGSGEWHDGKELKIISRSYSSNGDKVAYFQSMGMILYLGKEQDNNSIGFKADLRIIDLGNKKDILLTHEAFDWGLPQWSPDDSMILYTRPESDSYFNQDYLSQVVVKKNISWQKMAQSTIFVYDLKTNNSYRLCSGYYPQWSPDGNKIAFLTYANNIGIYDLQSQEIKELPVSGHVDPLLFRMTWSADQNFIAYLGKPRMEFLGALGRLAMGSVYERPSSLWIIKIDDARDQYIETRNIGDIKFAPDIYKDLFSE